jgi:hypothetical protein
MGSIMEDGGNIARRRDHGAVQGQREIIFCQGARGLEMPVFRHLLTAGRRNGLLGKIYKKWAEANNEQG